MLDSATIQSTHPIEDTLKQSQLDLEILFSKYQLIPTIQEYFQSIGAEAKLEAEALPVAFGIDLLTQISLHKRTTIGTMIGILRHHFEDEELPAQACSDMLVRAIQADVLSCVISNEMNQDGTYPDPYLMVIHEIPRELQDQLDRYQYPLPMIIEPHKLENNRQTGYVSIKGSAILKKNHHEDDICLDHLNRLNAQKLAINPVVLNFVQNQWKHLDKPKAGESAEKYRQRRKAFSKYDRVSRDVISALSIRSSLDQGFWLTHKYDKRGRTYSQGHSINYQGNDWNKGIVTFADAELLNDI